MSLTENKAGSAAVDPADFNALVDAVIALQAASVGSQPVEVLRVPIAFDTPGIGGPPGAVFYTPTVGDIIFAIGVSVTTAWNGSTPTLEMSTQGLDIAAVGLILGTNLEAVDHEVQTGGVLTAPDGAAPGAAVGMYFVVGTTPLVCFVDDNSGGDAGSTQGEGEIVLVILKAAS